MFALYISFLFLFARIGSTNAMPIPDPEALADSDTEDIKFKNGTTFKVQMLPPEQQNNEMPVGSDADMYKFVDGFKGKPAFLKIMTSEGDELGERVKKEDEYGEKVGQVLYMEENTQAASKTYYLVLRDVRKSVDGRSPDLGSIVEWYRDEAMGIENMLPQLCELAQKGLEELARTHGLLYGNLRFTNTFTDKDLTTIVFTGWAPESNQSKGVVKDGEGGNTLDKYIQGLKTLVQESYKTENLRLAVQRYGIEYREVPKV